jgi:hypothetical protein
MQHILRSNLGLHSEQPADNYLWYHTTMMMIISPYLVLNFASSVLGEEVVISFPFGHQDLINSLI